MNALASMDALCLNVAQVYGELSPQNLQRLAQIYHPDARFKDPFQDVQGLPKIQAIMAHMFASLHQPRFVVSQWACSENKAFLRWSFHYALGPGKRVRSFEGGSWLVFNGHGQITEHTDYWDASAAIFEQIPVLGWVIARIKSRFRAVS